MANIIEYMDWRGDVPFSSCPLNEVDNLIFSYLSYVEFDGIVPEYKRDKAVTLEEVNEEFWQKFTLEEVKERNPNTWEAAICLKKMAECARFRETKLSHFVNHIDEEEVKQFSAVTIEFAPHNYFIAFRGTDASIVGWKEDFYLSFQTVAAEKEAEDYLNYIASMLPGKIYVGGHSKGGNLAVYAAKNAHQQIQDKIAAIFSNDGPGFRKDVTETKGYLRIADRIHSFVPDTSIVGMLLCHAENYTVVKSSAAGIRQHDCMTWQLMGTRFLYQETTSEESKVYDLALSNWIDSMSYDERKEFTEALFGALDKAGIKNLNDLMEGNTLEKVTDILKEMHDDVPGLKAIKNAGMMLLSETARTLSGMFKEAFSEWTSKYKK